MPLNDYRCGHCKKTVEVLTFRFKDVPAVLCPDCGRKILKIPSASNFHLKGGGWYKDGYSKTS